MEDVICVTCGVVITSIIIIQVLVQKIKSDISDIKNTLKQKK